MDPVWKREFLASRGVPLLGALLLLWLSAAPVKAQTQQTSPVYTPPSTRSTPAGSNPLDTPPPSFGAGPSPMRIEKMREEERRKRLQIDMAKLVELTNELKTAVDKAGKDELSIDVVKKAAEIEKLARDVKERMRS